LGSGTQGLTRQIQTFVLKNKLLINAILQASNQQHFITMQDFITIHDWKLLPGSIKSITDLQMFKKGVKGRRI
jgi:hypothetical protein